MSLGNSVRTIQVDYSSLTSSADVHYFTGGKILQNFIGLKMNVLNSNWEQGGTQWISI